MLGSLRRLLSGLLPNLWFFNALIALPYFVKGNRRLPRAASHPRAGLNDFIFHRMIRNSWTVLEEAAVDKAFAKTIARGLSADVDIIETVDLIDPVSEAHIEKALQPYVGGAYVAKATNNSGGIVFLRKGLRPKDVRSLHALATDSFFHARRETQYARLRGRIIVERDISGEHAPVDYKFFCCNGAVLFCQVDTARFTSHMRTLFRLPGFARLDTSYGYPVDPNAPVPKNAPHMIAVASALSLGFEFVRVDLYEYGDKIVFGELTFSPTSGCDLIAQDDIATEMLQALRAHGVRW